MHSAGAVRVREDGNYEGDRASVIKVSVQPFVRPFQKDRQVTTDNGPPYDRCTGDCVLRLFRFAFLMTGGSDVCYQGTPPASTKRSTTECVSTRVPLRPTPLKTGYSATCPKDSYTSISVRVSAPLSDYKRCNHDQRTCPTSDAS